jgi:hypothetical protein
MNDGVRILLERMKTHPDEFAAEGAVSKWDVLINEYRDVLDVLDVKKLDSARRVLLQQRFTEQVMQELIDPIEKSNWTTTGFTSNRPSWQDHIDAHKKALGQTPIAGVTQTV